MHILVLSQCDVRGGHSGHSEGLEALLELQLCPLSCPSLIQMKLFSSSESFGRNGKAFGWAGGHYSHVSFVTVGDQNKGGIFECL